MNLLNFSGTRHSEFMPYCLTGVMLSLKSHESHVTSRRLPARKVLGKKNSTSEVGKPRFVKTKMRYGYGHRFRRLSSQVIKNIIRRIPYFAAFSVLLLICVYLVRSDLFLIKYISIEGTGRFVSEADIKSMVLTKIKGKSIFLTKTEDVNNAISDNFLAVKAVSTQKRLPDKVNITITERAPVAVIIDNTGKQYLADAEGYVMGEVNDEVTGFSKIIYDGKVGVGTFVHRNIIPLSAEILTWSEKYTVKVSSMSFSSDTITMHINDGIVSYLPLDENPGDAVLKLSEILKKMMSEGKVLKKVDLRYDKVIVSYD